MPVAAAACEPDGEQLRAFARSIAVWALPAGAVAPPAINPASWNGWKRRDCMLSGVRYRSQSTAIGR
jgi:hypothetical protein